MTKPLLSVVMIVKDEAHALAKTIESVQGVASKVTILDTGSSDGTQDVARGEVARMGGALHEGPFIDYASARNRALDLEASSADAAAWALSLSADETLRGDKEKLLGALREAKGDAVLIEVRTPLGAFPYPRILRVGGPWRYEGVSHEMPVHQGDRDRTPEDAVEGCWIEYAPTDPARLARRLREQDMPLLETMRKGAKTAAERARAILLLGQTREQIASTIADDVVAASQEMFAALGYYAYLSMDETTPAQARRTATWKYLNVAEMLGIHLPREMVPRLQRAAEEDPKNPAVLYMLARHTVDIDAEGRLRGDPRAGLQAAQKAAKVAEEAIKDPSAPHDPHGIRWRSHFLAATCAGILGHGPAAKKSAEAGIAAGGPTEAFEQFLMKNGRN